MGDHTPKTFSYLRVSTDSQDLEKDKIEVLKLAKHKDFGEVKFVEEKISGKAPWKTRKIKLLIDDLQKMDRLIVPELSRLGRSMLEVMEILSVCTQKGIEVYSVRDHWELNSTIQSKVIAAIFAMAAEIERDLISARTREALRARKAKGLPPAGRPKGYIVGSRLDKHKIEIWALRDAGIAKRYIARSFGVAEATLHWWLRSRKMEKADEECVRERTEEIIASTMDCYKAQPWRTFLSESKSMATMPDSYLYRMRDAAVNARLDILSEIAGEVETYDKGLTDRLRIFITKYDYDAIFKALGIKPWMPIIKEKQP